MKNILIQLLFIFMNEIGTSRFLLRGIPSADVPVECERLFPALRDIALLVRKSSRLGLPGVDRLEGGVRRPALCHICRIINEFRSGAGKAPCPGVLAAL
jgi:hypothetical protein